jgi:hypothetical protein
MFLRLCITATGDGVRETRIRGRYQTFGNVMKGGRVAHCYVYQRMAVIGTIYNAEKTATCTVTNTYGRPA